MVGLSVVIPTFRGTPESVIQGLRNALGSRGYEVLLVDDGSGAPWRGSLEELASRHDDIRLIPLAERRGQAYATLVGVAAAKGRIVVTMDDDGEHPPEAVPDLVSRLDDGMDGSLDLVYGVPRQPRRPNVLRRLGTGLNNALFTLCLGKPLRVPVTSFRAMRRDLLTAALRSPVRFGYLSAMLFAAGCRAGVYYYRPSESESTSSSHSRYGLPRLVRLYWNLLLHWGPLKPLGTFSGLPKRRFG